MQRAPPHAARERPPRRGLLRALKIGLIVLACLVGLPVVALLALVGTLTDERLLPIALHQVRLATGLALEARGLELHLLEGLTLEGVRLRPPPGFRDAPLEVERLTLGYAPGELVDGRLRVHSLRLERPHLRLQHDGTRTNLEALLAGLTRAAPPGEAPPEDASQPAGLELLLERGEIRDLAVDLDLPGVRAALRGLSLDLGARLGGAGERELVASLRLPAPRGDNLDLGGGLAAAVGLVLEGRFGAEGGQATISVDATSVALGRRRLRVELQASLPPAADALHLPALRLLLDGAPVLEGRGALAELSGRRAYHLELSPVVLLAGDGPGLAALIPGLPALEGRASLREVALDGALGGGWPRLAGLLTLDGLGLRLPGLEIDGLRGELQVGHAPEPGKLELRGQLRADGLMAAGVRLLRPRGMLQASGLLAPGAAPGPGLREPRLHWRGVVERLHAAEAQADELSLELRLGGPRADLEAGAFAVPSAELALEGSCRAVSLLGRGHGRFGMSLGPLELRLSASASGLGLRPGGVPRAERLTAHLELRAARLRQDALQVESLGLELEAQAGSLLGGGGRAPGSLEARVSTGPLARGPLALARSGLVLRLPLESLRPAALSPRVTVRAEELVWARAEGRPPFRAPGELSLEADARLELGALRVEVTRAALSLGDVLELGLSGAFEPAARTFRGELRAAPHRVEALVASLPEDLRARVPGITGQVQLEGWARGRLPVGDLDLRALPVEAELTLGHKELSVELPAVGLRVRGVSGPARVRVGGEGEAPLRGSFELCAEELKLLSPALTARGLSVAMASSWSGEELLADGRSAAESVEAPGLWPEPIGDLQLDLAALLSGLKELRLTEFALALGSVGLRLSGTGQVVRPPEATELADLRLDLRTRVGLTAERAVRLPGGFSASGKAEAELAVKSVQPGVLHAEGRLVFGGLDLAAGGFTLLGAAGAVPVSQYVALRPEPGLLAQRPEAGVARRGAAREARSAAYESALRPLKGEERSFLIRELGLHDLRFSELSGNLELSGGTLALNGLRFRFLGGDFLADTSLTLAPPGTRRLGLDAEMSGVELAELPWLASLAVGGPSDVSGNLRLAVDLEQDEVGASFNLTQIGRDTLQSLLLAVDPGQSNPGVQELRRYLDSYDVSPRQVAVNIRHGLLSMRVEFDLGLVARAAARFLRGFQGDAFELSHLPVGDFLAKYLRR